MVFLAGHKRLFGHPHDHRIEPVVYLGHVARPHEHVATARVDLVLERKGDGERGKCLVELTVESHD
jgi:hypothetical protein